MEIVLASPLCWMLGALIVGRDSFFSTFLVGLFVFSFFLRFNVFVESLLPIDPTTQEREAKIMLQWVMLLVAFIASHELVLGLFTGPWGTSPEPPMIIWALGLVFLAVTIANYLRWFKRVEAEMQSVLISHDMVERAPRRAD